MKKWWHRLWCFDCKDYDGALAYAKASSPRFGLTDRWVKQFMKTWAEEAKCTRRMDT
jgi:hypothetical protein